MGIIFSTNTLGFSSLNLFGAFKVGDDQVNTVGGIFSNINLDRGPLVAGFFGETTVAGHAVNLNYASIADVGENIQAGIRIHLFADEYVSWDINFAHSMTNLFGTVKFSRYSGNMCYTFADGFLLSFGITHTPLFNTTTADFIIKMNLWKSAGEAVNVDLTSNMSIYAHGPLLGHHTGLLSLTISYDWLCNKHHLLEKPPLLESLRN
ncbi:hypothetical protein DOY81_001791 [Sarcophaga bullata]|nr:hypothetical protein DOY81_001791 [Sarcophaga bullata]